MSGKLVKTRLINSWRAAAIPAGLLLWSAASHLGWVDANFLPAPERVVERAWTQSRHGTLLLDLGASLLRDLSGFAIGSLAGIATGLLLGFSETARRLFGPLLRVHRQIALFAWVPLISVWMGSGEAGKITFIALAAFQPNVTTSWQALRELPQRYRELAAVLTLSRLDFIRFIALPATVPAIFTGLHAGLIYAWQATIAAELFMTIAPGIGGQMMEGRQLFQMDLVLVCILLLGLIGIFFNKSAAFLETILLRRRTT